jgi:cytochrome P450
VGPLHRLLAKLEALAHKLPAFITRPIDTEFEKIRTEVEHAFAHLQSELLHADPEPVFAILRRIKPILKFGDFVLVTRFGDVEEVLDRDDVFAQPYADKFALLTGGQNFFLGMANTPQYTHDVSVMRLVVRREDLPTRIVPFVQRTAESLVTASKGRLEIVSGLAAAVPTAFCGDYFGTPSPVGNVFAPQSAAMSGFLFLPKGGNQADAVAAAQVMRLVLSAQIAARKKDRGTHDDVLGRMLTLQAAGEPGLTDEWILNQLFSFVVAAIPTTAAAVARAMDELLRRPDQLAGAQAAARAGDTLLVQRYVFEAMRFSPLGPGVFRTATADYVLAAGTIHETTIPRGATVLAALLSAMFDHQRIDRPGSFVLDRPSWAYLHFGYGLHTCFGQYINAMQIPLIAQALLKTRNLRRAPGVAGTLQFDGAFPSSMTLEFDP